MSDYIHNVMWYTVWDAKTGDLVASGTAGQCAPDGWGIPAPAALPAR